MRTKALERLNLYFECWAVFLLANFVSMMLFAPQEVTEMPQITTGVIVPMLVYTCGVVPLIEELLFRKFAFWIFQTMDDEWKLLLSSLLFAAAHHEPEQFLPALCLGLMLGRVYLDSHSFKTCYLLHATTNLVDGILMLLFPITTITVVFVVNVVTVVTHLNYSKIARRKKP